MDITDLMTPPRLYTALAEWSACMTYILLMKRKKKFTAPRLTAACAAMLLFFMIYQYTAGLLPLYLWIPGMAGAIAGMYFGIHIICDISAADAGFCCVRAFVLAEFAAAFQWQLYVWQAVYFNRPSLFSSLCIMLCTYVLCFCLYFYLESRHIPAGEPMNVRLKELAGDALIALSAFAISNLSFVAPNTPFSAATNSLLYVRTLVDFGGLVILFSQQDRREELRMRMENDAMNTILQRQYNQFRLAQDNMELLRREFHDLKHYMIALRQEQDPQKREQYLLDMENAIHTQEAFTNTGNQVLDVVLTTKSSQCQSKHITFQCMADGSLIGFLHVKDICSIFGNALDNAMECVLQYEDPQKRLINLSVYQKNGFLMIQCENCCEKPPAVSGGIPATTKNDKKNHGYGLKSIRMSAEKYGGSMTIRTPENWFILQVLIPMPK